jgi:MOSC domain-containing protein YiiM
MQLVSIQIGKPETRTSPVRDGKNARWTSGIFKTPVTGPRAVELTQMDGDGQADLVNHGGPDKALNCYCAEHYPNWRAALALPSDVFGYGAFGENFTLSGMAEDLVCIGDIYAVGTARVQVSQPRVPCYKLGRRWEMADLPQRVIASGQTGYYLRVLEPGVVEAGDAVSLIERPEPEWTVARMNDAYYHRKADRALAAHIARLDVLAEAWRNVFRRRVDASVNQE